MTQARKARDAETTREKVMGVGLRVTVGDQAYTVYEGEVSALDTLAVRQQTGVSFQGWLNIWAGGDGDYDAAAVVVWLARRLAGERTLAYADVAATLFRNDETRSVSLPPTGEPAEPVTDEATGEGEDSPEA